MRLRSLESGNESLCSPARLATAVAPCAQRCSDGVTVIKRSERLSWLTRQSDVDLRARGFFSPGVCFRCLVKTAQIPTSCTRVSLMLLSNAFALNGKHSEETSYIVAALERRPSFLFYTMQCTNQCAPTLGLRSAVYSACYCRACATLPDWSDFEAFCRRFSPPDLPECARLTPLLSINCGGASASSELSPRAELSSKPVSYLPHHGGGKGESDDDGGDSNSDAGGDSDARGNSDGGGDSGGGRLTQSAHALARDAVLEYSTLGDSPLSASAVANCRSTPPPALVRRHELGTHVSESCQAAPLHAHHSMHAPR